MLRRRSRLAPPGAVLALALVAASLGAALRPEAALACSCVAPHFERTTVPADQALGFPTNGRISVFLSGFPEAVRASLGGEYRLVDAQDAPVPLDVHEDGRRLELRPRAALHPDARYTLQRLYAYDAAGARLSDTERLGAGRGAASGVRLAWFAEVSFRTGPGPAAPRAGVVPSLTRAALHFAHGGGDCGPGLAVGAEVQLPPTARPTDVLALEVRGTGVPPRAVATFPAHGTTRVGVSDLLCDPDTVVVPYHGALSLRVVVRDAAGAVVGATAWTAAEGQPRVPLTPAWHQARQDAPVPRLPRGGAWALGPIVAASAAPTSGPGLCPFGLEASAAPVELASQGAPWMYEEVSTMAFDGAQGWVAIETGAEPSQLSVSALDTSGAATRLRLAIPGYVEAAAAGPAGPVFVTRVYAQDLSSTVTLRALGRNGADRWTRQLPGDGRAYRLAVGGGQVLAVYAKRHEVRDATLGWALFDDASGAPVAPPRNSAHRVHMDGSPAAAFVGNGFLAAWTAAGAAGRAAVTAIGRDGRGATPATLAIPADGFLDMASAGTRAALVAGREGQIRWALLDATGAVVRGPVVVSAGVGGGANRSARVTHHDGLFAVAWESTPSRETFATVVDASGAVAPALALWAGRESSTPLAVAAPQRRFVGTFSVGNARLLATPLRCRASAPPGAPARLAP